MVLSRKRALISVYYKEGIEKVASALHADGWEIISTGGTASFLTDHSIPVTPVSDITEFPEILNGRVKTLHPGIFAPILAENSKEHLDELKKFSLTKIDLVIVNFYPFEEYLKKKAGIEEMIEKIDIGGPSMVRAAAKNYLHTVVIVREEDYGIVEEKLITGKIDVDERKRLSAKAFSYTSFYDSLISNYLNPQNVTGNDFMNISGKKHLVPRYGENPHQRGAIYITDENSPMKTLRQLQGKQLSYNNIMDISSVYDIVNEFPEKEDHFCVIVKHQNPCGASLAEEQSHAYENALTGDPVSAFGGIVGFNKIIDTATAEKLSELFLEVIVSPGFSSGALKILGEKKNLRLIEVKFGYHERMSYRSVQGGFVLQDKDTKRHDISALKIMTERKPDDNEMKDIDFGWKLIKFIKSNAILIVKDRRITGVGAGQMSRIDSVNLALSKAGNALGGSVLLSDAFFPFSDSIETAVRKGINVIVEPGGSVRDQEVIESAERSGISLIFTGSRHFLH